MDEAYVCKFGGSSLATKEDIAQVASIIRDDPRRQYIVVSAPGTRDGREKKVTGLLKDIYAVHEKGGDTKPLIDAVAERYEAIYGGISSKVADNLHERLSSGLAGDRLYAYLLSAGEFWQAKLFASYLHVPFVDAAQFIAVKGNLRNASVEKGTMEKIATIKNNAHPVVMGGFYGATEDGHIGLLSEGGSDFTGSLVAAGVGADTYENFTDSVVFTAHPKIVPRAQPILEMTRKELRDLSYSGFSIFQDRAIAPLEGTGITVQYQVHKRLSARRLKDCRRQTL